MRVYAGGPVDYNGNHGWQHELGTDDVFCPVCANEGETEPMAILDRNLFSLFDAEYMVARLDGFSIGTPIEVHQRVRYSGWAPRTVCLVHPGKPGIYVSRWYQLGVAVVPDLEGARAWLAAR